MNHDEAIESHAAEGYLLGDLSETERDAFEEHYFDCTVCSDTIRAGAAMFAAGREVVKSPKPIPFPLKWFSGARAIAAALAVVVGIQGYAIYLLRRPLPLMEVMAPGIFITGTTRAGANEIPPIHFQGEEPVKVSVEIESETPYPSYRLELRDSSGKRLVDIDVPDERVRTPEGDALNFLLRPLPAGRYVLAIEGVQKDGNRLPIDSPVIVVQ